MRRWGFDCVGRVFTENDRGHNVAIVSESAARRVWPGESAVGKRYGPSGRLNPKPEDLIEVIGIVADVCELPGWKRRPFR